MLTILDSPIMTSYGSFRYEQISLDEARDLINEQGFESAVNDKQAADMLTELLGVPVSVNQNNYVQKAQTDAIVFKRLPEGYEFGLLVRY